MEHRLDYELDREPSEPDEDSYRNWLTNWLDNDSRGAQLERILTEDWEKESPDRYCGCGNELDDDNCEVCRDCR